MLSNTPGTDPGGEPAASPEPTPAATPSSGGRPASAPAPAATPSPAAGQQVPPPVDWETRLANLNRQYSQELNRHQDTRQQLAEANQLREQLGTQLEELQRNLSGTQERTQELEGQLGRVTREAQVMRVAAGDANLRGLMPLLASGSLVVDGSTDEEVLASMQTRLAEIKSAIGGQAPAAPSVPSTPGSPAASTSTPTIAAGQGSREEQIAALRDQHRSLTYSRDPGADQKMIEIEGMLRGLGGLGEP